MKITKTEFLRRTNQNFSQYSKENTDRELVAFFFGCLSGLNQVENLKPTNLEEYYNPSDDPNIKFSFIEFELDEYKIKFQFKNFYRNGVLYKKDLCKVISE